MRPITLGLSLVALLLITTAVVYAGVSWDDDPSVPIGGGYWAHLQSGTDKSGEVNTVREEIEGGFGDGRLWARGCTDFKGIGEAAVRVWISKGHDGVVLADTAMTSGDAPGHLCAQVELDLD